MSLVEGADGNPGQRLQILWLANLWEACQQRRRGDDGARHLCQLYGNRGGIDLGTHADRTINIVAEEIHRLIVQHPLNGKLRITLQKFRQRFQELFLTKGVRCPHPQYPNRFILRLPDFIFQRQPAINHPPGMLIAAFTVVSEPGGMGGSQQQASPQQRFQRLQTSAYRGLSRRKLPCRCRERAGFHDANKSSHQFHPVYTLNSLHTFLCHTLNV